MKIFLSYITSFYKNEFRWLYFSIVFIFLSVTIWLFYSFKSIATLIGGGASGIFHLFSDLCVFGISFLIPILLYLFITHDKKNLTSGKFWFFIFFALCVFCFKVFFYWQHALALLVNDPQHWNYWQNCIGNLTSSLLLVFPLIIYWFFIDRPDRFYGMKIQGINWKPYLIILAIFLPAIIIASQFHNFQQQYPKYAIVLNRGKITEHPFAHGLFYEFCYGLDFISTEIFFRGFLVIGLSKYLGRGAIIPAAVFYVFIHFGKPLQETMGSFFGGILLGILAYETKSIWGGVLLHLGTAYLMEICAGLAR